MTRLPFIIICVLSAYAAGTVIGPPAIATVKDVGATLSPFFIISLAILIASLGYAGSVFLSAFKRGRRGEREGLRSEIDVRPGQ